MNIQNLLKKIGERRQKRREGNGAISSERIAKNTFEDTSHNHASIGTLNQMPNTLNDRSYFKQYFQEYATDGGERESEEDRKEEFSLIDGLQSNTNKPNKLERIESELDQIEKMKSVFENKKRLDTHGSIERNCLNKSVEKHNLKPCQIPKFKQTSEFVISNTSNFKDNPSATFKDQGFTDHVNITDQVISFKGAEIFDDSRVDSKRSISLRNQQCWSKNKPIANSLVQRCVCEANLKDFMAQVGQKMGLLASRISQLQQSNSNLKAKHEKVINSNIRAAQILQKLQEQKNELMETQQKWSQSKSELQSLLKGVIIKKQKQVAKQNMSKQDCENYFKYKDKARSPIKKQIVLEQKKGGSKNKVQSLLQRLQLRVQKS